MRQKDYQKERLLQKIQEKMQRADKLKEDLSLLLT